MKGRHPLGGGLFVCMMTGFSPFNASFSIGNMVKYAKEINSVHTDKET